MSTMTNPSAERDLDRRRRRSMLVAASGTIIEWYDFSIFYYVATILTKEFFGGNAESLLLTLGVGATGFLFRPLGALVFGHLGDRVGRKSALVISAVLMAVSMLGVAVMPGSSVIGIWAGAGVIFFRCLAGFSVGAEYTGIMVYLMESATHRRRGLAASWASANSEVGALLAVGIGALLANTLPASAMESWGWRLLFIIGALLALIMIPLRRLMDETETFKRLQTEPIVATTSPIVVAVKTQRRAIIVAFLISAVGSVAYFLNITYVPTYLEQVTHLQNAGSLALGTIAAVVAIVVTPFIGLASDRFGRRRSFGVLVAVFAVTTIPAYALLAANSSVVAIFGTAFLAIPAAGWSAVAAAAVPEQFTALGRFSGMAIGYNIATVVFGGFSPLIATALMVQTGWSLAPAFYATAIAVLAGVPILIWFRDMTGRPLAEVDASGAQPITTKTAEAWSPKA